MRMYAALFVLILACLGGLVACDQQSKVEDQKTFKTPGGETQVETERSVEKSGDHKTPDAR
jgi:hypothetical protein